MFKAGDKVIYPRYGAGVVNEISTVYIDNDKKEYYEIEFYHSQISVSVPVENAEMLGLRKPFKKEELVSALKDLGKKVKVNPLDISNIDVITRDKLKSGEIEDAVYIINMIKAHSKVKQKENKKISFTESKYLESAQRFISSVVETILGKKALEKYELDSYQV